MDWVLWEGGPDCKPGIGWLGYVVWFVDIWSVDAHVKRPSNLDFYLPLENNKPVGHVNNSIVVE